MIIGKQKQALVEELQLRWHDKGGYSIFEMCATFILEDRKRIVEPLVKLERTKEGYIITDGDAVDEAVDQTLRNAGIGD